MEVEAESESEAIINLEQYYEMKSDDYYLKYTLEDVEVIPRLTKLELYKEEEKYNKRYK